MKRFFRIIRRHNELLIWVAALIYLYSIDPLAEPAINFCFFHWIGIDFCPGCGIGRSIGAALHFDWQESLQLHWFGIPALLIIFYRILTLLKQLVYGIPAAKPAYEHPRSAT